MQIAHFSDLHVLDLEGVSPHRFFNKRLSGWANLRLKRKHVHHSRYVRAVAQEVARHGIGQVVITGDITNLALEPEFQAARAILEDDLRLSSDDVSIIPGNHDFYTRGALENRRFTEFFGAYAKSDLALATHLGTGDFPFVRLRGRAAIIGLSTAVPRPPFVASGNVGTAQLEALARILAHPEVASRTPVILIHHPLHNPKTRGKTLVEVLVDADELGRVLRVVPRGLVLHGHLHKRIRRSFQTDFGELFAIGATSASLHHDDEHKMSGFNLYEIDDTTGAITTIEARVFDERTSAFRVAEIPYA
ncbi:metallophosphoesterase [soil metagenome]